MPHGFPLHYEAINVETRSRNPHSLLSWMWQILRLRQRARVQVAHDHLHEFGYVYDAGREGSFAESLFDLIAGGRTVKSPQGRLVAKATRAFPRIQGETSPPAAATAKGDAHTNTIVLCGDRFLL